MAAKKETTHEPDVNIDVILEECFVIMPISDQPNYDPGHFGKVYEDIFKPACLTAGYTPRRADDVKQSNLIHLDILKRVVNSPMAICDLSGRNPNVLFELGLRQAFDKPTILVKDLETPEIFDIAPIRYTTYRRELRYREVLIDQKAIAEAIRSTKNEIGKTGNVNSLIRLLELSAPASVHVDGENSDPRELFQILMAEISQLKKEVRSTRMSATSAEVTARVIPANVVIQGALLAARMAGIRRHLDEGKNLSEVHNEITEALRLCNKLIANCQESENAEDRSRLAKFQLIANELNDLVPY